MEEIDDSIIKVYPNPVTDLLTIDSDTPLSMVQIFDIKGAQIKIVERNANFYNIDMSNYNSGIYHVLMTKDDGGQVIKRIVK